mmetsp:Transcript_72888/g.158202  ORF Transcript_72888/g.158202 Transcript_72888/m.158202 type:complete len:307 (-) Transcript_72888:327-1247(-)
MKGMLPVLLHQIDQHIASLLDQVLASRRVEVCKHPGDADLCCLRLGLARLLLPIVFPLPATFPGVFLQLDAAPFGLPCTLSRRLLLDHLREVFVFGAALLLLGRVIEAHLAQQLPLVGSDRAEIFSKFRTIDDVVHIRDNPQADLVSDRYDVRAEGHLGLPIDVLEEPSEDRLRLCPLEVRHEVSSLQRLIEVEGPRIKGIGMHTAVPDRVSQVERQADLRSEVAATVEVVHDLARQQVLIVNVPGHSPLEVEVARVLVIVLKPSAGKQCIAEVRVASAAYEDSPISAPVSPPPLHDVRAERGGVS